MASSAVFAQGVFYNSLYLTISGVLLVIAVMLVMEKMGVVVTN